MSVFYEQQFMVAKDGVLIETFYSPGDSRRTVLNEQQVNEMLTLWVANRKQLQAQQQLINDVMRKNYISS